MAARDLDAVGVGHKLGLPMDDPVALGVDARQVHRAGGKRRGEVTSEAALTACGEALQRAGATGPLGDGPGGRDRLESRRAGAEHALQVGPDGDRVRDEVGAAGCQRPGVMAATAVADEGCPATVAFHDRLETTLDSIGGPIRARDVGDESAQLWPVADPVKPRRHHGQRLIAAEESRHQHDGSSVAVGDIATGEHGVDEQARGLEGPARLGQRPAPPPGRRFRLRIVHAA